MGEFARPLLREDRDWSLLPRSLRASQRPHQSAHKLERARRRRANQEDFQPREKLRRDFRKRDQPGKPPTQHNFQLRKPKRTDFRQSETTFPRHHTMLEGAIAGEHDRAGTGVLPPHPGLGCGGLQHLHLQGGGGGTTGKQHTRVFSGLIHVEENSNDTAMINTTINFDDLLLGETVGQSTSTAPTMDMMIEEENQNLTIERNTVPLPEDTTNIMELI